jgi:DNA-binding response OmpR family regulator
VRLTKSEFLLANLFIGRLGSVISLPELFDFFSSHGKAATQSNVRVGIFELRLKLEKLSGSALGLVSVYRRGYALRQNSCRNAMQ